MKSKILSKIIIIGNSAVGKTSLLNSYVEQKYTQLYKATIGADFLSKEIVIDGKAISLEIWDTAGQDRFKCLGNVFYRGTDCCVVVFDLSDKKSFESVGKWIEDFLEIGMPQNPLKFPIVILGNKSDLVSARQVNESDINKIRSEYPQIVGYFEVSAKNQQKVNEAFEDIARKSIQNKVIEIYKPRDYVPFIINKKPKKTWCTC